MQTLNDLEKEKQEVQTYLDTILAEEDSETLK